MLGMEITQKRDTLDDYAALWKSNREGDSAIDGPPGIRWPYKESPWIYSCCNAIARNVAQIPFKFWQNDKEVQQHWVVDLFKKPNPLMNGYELWFATEIYLNLGGNALWVPVPSQRAGQIAELWVFNRHQFAPKMVDGRFLGWDVQWAGKIVDFFEPQEVLHFRYFNPYDPVMGMAPMEVARESINQEWWANKYNTAFFKNFAEAGTVISFPGAYDSEVAEAARNSWDQRHQGYNRAKRTAVLFGGATIEDMGTTQRDMQFVEQKKWTREEVLAVFRVPPVEIGLMDNVSSRVESQRAQRRLFGEEVIAPELKCLETGVGNLIGQWGLTFEAYFDVSEVDILQDSLGEKIDKAKVLFDMLVPFNAINEKLDLGFEPTAWGDEAFVQGTMVPASALLLGGNPNPDNPPTDNPPPDNTPPEDTTPVPGSGLSSQRYVDQAKVRKFRRILFELRNEILNEKDGIGKVNWDRVARRLDNVLPEGVSEHVVTRLKVWATEAHKDAVRSAVGNLKNSAASIVAQERAQEVQEIIDSEATWRAYDKVIRPLEKKYESRVRTHFRKLGDQYIGLFLAQNANRGPHTRAQEPSMDWAEQDRQLQELVDPVVRETVTTMGKCSVVQGTPKAGV